MECGEAKQMLSAYHDGELSEADRAKVAAHVDGCAECAAVLDTLARIDDAAGVPDPGPAYWGAFNGRVEARIAQGERAAREEPKAGRPRRAWIRQQWRYLVPAAAAAVLAVVIFRNVGTTPGTPSRPPSTMEARQAPVPEVLKPASSARDSTGGAYSAPAASRGTAPAAPEPAGAMRRETDEAGGRKEQAAGAVAPSAVGSPGPKTMAAAQGGAGNATEGGCEEARALAGRGRLDAAEAAQRACLERDTSAAAQERGLIYLAELLDRQHRFADADQVIEEMRTRFPDSRLLETYLQRRSRVQGLPAPSPNSTLR